MKLTEVQKQTMAERLESDMRLEEAYLFGSQAKGTSGPLSDVDVAIRCVPGLTDQQRMDARGDVLGILTSLFNTNDVDVVDLESTGILVRYRAVTDGRRLFTRHPASSRRFRFESVGLFEDFRPYLDRHLAFIKQRFSSST